MKKSKAIQLILVAGIAASCSHKNDYENATRLNIRGDTTSLYTQTRYYPGYVGYYHFIPFGFYSFGRGYIHGGYDSPHFSSKAGSIARGGFGRSGFRVGG